MAALTLTWPVQLSQSNKNILTIMPNSFRAKKKGIPSIKFIQIQDIKRIPIKEEQKEKRFRLFNFNLKNLIFVGCQFQFRN